MTTQRSVPDLCLIRGGFIYRVERWLGLIDESHWHLGRRILVFWFLTWIPIAVLEVIRISGLPPGPSEIALYDDLRMNVRLLFCAPLLIAAEALIDYRLKRAVAQFVQRKLLDDHDDQHERFQAAVTQANQTISGYRGIWIEAAILLLCFGAGFSNSWTSTMGPLSGLETFGTIGGRPFALGWYTWIALPLFEFLQLRWMWRFFVWTELLFRISRLRLKLIATHPDLLGGLGIVAFAQESFAFLWLAMSAGAASTVAFRVMNQGVQLQMFYLPVAAFVGIEALLLLAPLTLFVPQLVIARREGLLDYGKLSSEYIRLFDQKWVLHSVKEVKESFLGSSDIQSLADLGNSFDRVKKMQLIPADKTTIIRIVFAGAIPFLPLIFLVARVEDVLRAVIKMVF